MGLRNRKVQIVLLTFIVILVLWLLYFTGPPSITGAVTGLQLSDLLENETPSVDIQTEDIGNVSVEEISDSSPSFGGGGGGGSTGGGGGGGGSPGSSPPTDPSNNDTTQRINGTWILNNESEFDTGNYSYATSNGDQVELNGTTSGTYLNLFDASGTTVWKTISVLVDRIYKVDLPNNEESDADINMSENKLLLHFENFGLADSSGHGNHGNGAISFFSSVESIYGYAALLTQGNYVEVSDNSLDNIGVDGFTLEAWIKSLGEDFKYRSLITLDSATEINEQIIEVVLDPTTFSYDLAKPDGGDIRFYEVRGDDQYSHFIETWNASGTSVIKVRIEDNGTHELIMYYGNKDAKLKNSSSDIYLFYEDFESYTNQVDGEIPAGWTDYKGGRVVLFTLPLDQLGLTTTRVGYKVLNNDGSGGAKRPINLVVTDYKLELDTYKVGISQNGTIGINQSGQTNQGGPLSRYAVSDNDANGYGTKLSAKNDPNGIGIEIRNKGKGSSLSITYPNLSPNIWYHEVFIKHGDNFTFYLYQNDTLIANTSVTNSTHSGPFTNFYIHGGQHYYTDNIKISAYSGTAPSVVSISSPQLNGVNKGHLYGIGLHDGRAFSNIDTEIISSLLPSSDFNHITLVYDSTEQSNQHKLYINAVGVNSTNATDFPLGIDNITVGYLINLSYIDEIAIYDRVLTDEEIYARYVRGAGDFTLQYRSCVEKSCSNETWSDATDVLGNEVNLSINGSQYFQVNATLTSLHEEFSPIWYNMSVAYDSS